MARIAHTILGNPFVHGRNSPEKPLFNGPMPAKDTLSIHLGQLAKLQPKLLAAVLLVLPRDSTKEEVPGYRNISAAVAGFPLPLELLEVNNNSLGSYGMYLHAFAATRGRYSFYLFCEDDYVPAQPDFDAALLRMHTRAFPGNHPPGVLAGVLQGTPAEPESPLALHLETAHIMSSNSLQHLFHHVYVHHGWAGSTSDWMLHLLHASRGKGRHMEYYGGAIQAGFGLMLSNASIEMRDWSRAYRSPYWNHRNIVDWTGTASNFSLSSEFARILIHHDMRDVALRCPSPSIAAAPFAQWEQRYSSRRSSFTPRPKSGTQRAVVRRLNLRARVEHVRAGCRPMLLPTAALLGEAMSTQRHAARWCTCARP